MRVESNSRVENISEGCFEGVKADDTVRGNSVKGQTFGLRIQIHPDTTGAQGLRSYMDLLFVVLNKKTLISRNQTPRLVIVSQLAIIHIPFPVNVSVC